MKTNTTTYTKIFARISTILIATLLIADCSVTANRNRDVRRSADDTGNQLRRQEQCTQDVIKCPDGRYVGRDPDNGCQFKLCE